MIESEPFASALQAEDLSSARRRVKDDDDATDTNDDCCCVKRGPLATDPMSGKATEIRVLSFKRPHMRAFHCSWISFFVSFFIWFAIVPLLPYIKDSLDLTERQLFISNLFNLIPTERLIVGPLCDRYGPRKVFLVLLCLASIPTACTGLVNSAAGLYILRFFIGMAGGSFVICQYWSTAMFAPDIVGAANGFVGGWGNLGGGVTQLVVGTGLLPAFLTLMSPDMAWRTVSLIPAGLGLITGIVVFFISDDSPCPGGRHCRSIVAASATMAEHEGSLYDSVRSAYSKSATFLLFFHYMVSFGVELTMLGSIAMYFVEVFGLNNSQASAVASIFGWMNIFARGGGGWASDKANAKKGIKGRIWVHALFLAIEGIFVIALPFATSFKGALSIMIFFSIFVQAAEGTTFGLVPYVDIKFPGAVSGFVSSGGNIGGLIFTSLFLVCTFKQVFVTMGVCCWISVPLAIFIRVEQQSDTYEASEEENNGNSGKASTLGTRSSNCGNGIDEEDPKP